jgi:CheY-like chemotaxis protein
VESAPGSGSTFRLRLTLAKQDAAHTAASVRRKRDMIRHTRLLFVTPQFAGVDTVIRQTEAWGLACDYAESGSDALAVIHEAVRIRAAFELVIIDHELKDMRGLELAEAIRADPRLRHAHLLMMVPWGRRDEYERLRPDGIEGVITKPIKQAQLLDRLLGVLFPEYESREWPRPPELDEERGRMLTGLRVLLAEDDEINRKVTMQLLKQLGCGFQCVDNGVDAVTAVQRGGIDIVLMDCQMPVMTGYEAATRIRRAESGGRRVPIIALTAQAQTGDRSLCLQAGMDDYLTKPLEPKQLADTLVRWTRGGPQPPPRPVDSGPQAGEESGAPPLDPERLDLISGHDAKFRRELLDGFVADAGDYILELGRAAELQDQEALHRVAHRLRGAAANVGAGPLSRLAGRIEAAARRNDLAEIQVRVRELQDAYSRVVSQAGGREPS